MSFDIEQVRVEPLNGAHQLDKFPCSSEPIQNFCRGGLRAANDCYAVKAFVATHDGDPRIVGYYYLCLSTISHDDLGREKEGDFLHLEAIPTVYLGMLGVDQRLMRRGIGRLLMADALARVAAISQHAGTYALTLDAVDEDAATYYVEKFDFQRFAPDGLKMFLEIKTILALDLSAAPA